jgi:hypothetical protein
MAGLIGQVIVIASLLAAWLHGLQTFQHALMLGLACKHSSPLPVLHFSDLNFSSLLCQTLKTPPKE